MARGFESKDVEFQQAEAERGQPKRPALTADQREVEARRREIELALAKVRAERKVATNPHHKTMLDRAIVALEDEFKK